MIHSSPATPACPLEKEVTRSAADGWPAGVTLSCSRLNSGSASRALAPRAEWHSHLGLARNESLG